MPEHAFCFVYVLACECSNDETEEPTLPCVRNEVLRRTYILRPNQLEMSAAENIAFTAKKKNSAPETKAK